MLRVSGPVHPISIDREKYFKPPGELIGIYFFFELLGQALLFLFPFDTITRVPL
jgi:hypothetical protein